MKELLENRISYIYMDKEKECLVFMDNWCDQFWAYATEAECCSTTWFESINNPENMINEKIIGIEVKPEKDCDSSSDDDVIVAYGYTIKTAKGYTDIEFRNSSNGYYGGSCHYIHDAKLIFPTVTYHPSKILSMGLPISLTFNDGNFNTTIYPYKEGSNG